MSTLPPSLCTALAALLASATSSEDPDEALDMSGLDPELVEAPKTLEQAIKDLAKTHLVDEWDHAFLAFAGDRAIIDFLNSLPDHKTVILDRVPTAENLARIAFNRLNAVYRDTYGNHLQLERVRLYETPNCWADAARTDSAKSV